MASTMRKTVTSYTAQRVEFTSNKPLKETLSLLYEELNKDKAGMALRKSVAEAQTKDEIDTSLGALFEGKRDFLYFFELSHSAWMNKYFGGSIKLPESHVITLGNPLTASTIVPHDPRAGLYAPLRVYLQETEEGGTLVMYDLPSSVMIRPDSAEEMKKVAHVLDAKVEKLFTRIL